METFDFGPLYIIVQPSQRLFVTNNLAWQLRTLANNPAKQGLVLFCTKKRIKGVLMQKKRLKYFTLKTRRSQVGKKVMA